MGDGLDARRLGTDQRHQRRELLADAGTAQQALDAAPRHRRIEILDVELHQHARARMHARVRRDRSADEKTVRGTVHRQVLGDLFRDPLLDALQVRLRRGDQPRRAIALRHGPPFVVRSGIDLAMKREPAQLRDRHLDGLRERVDIGECRQRIVLALALGILGIEAIDIGGVVPPHARTEVHDMRGLVRSPRALVELLARATLFVAPRFVRLLLGLADRCRARIGQTLTRDLGVDPFANAAGRGDIDPTQYFFRRHASPRKKRSTRQLRYHPHGTR